MSPSCAPSALLHYAVEPADVHAHLYHITLTIAAPAAQQEVSMPAWIPGSYLVREFAKNVQCLEAYQADAPLSVTALTKDRWRICCDPSQALHLRYHVCAYDSSVRAAWLDAQRGFFNATSLCMRVQGQTEQPCELTIFAPKNIAASADWYCASALLAVEVDAQGFGRYRAADYDELADCPVAMGPFCSTEFEVHGITHRLVVTAAPSTCDMQRLVHDTRQICHAVQRFWHPEGQPAPFTHYTFMLHATHEGYGGLEHRNSTALVCSRRDLPRYGLGSASSARSASSGGYTTLLGLISHEYFHAWNVKRLRPVEFTRYCYERENYTELLWFFEGFTSYYDDLLLRRAALIDTSTYLKLLTKAINQVLQTPGRTVQSLAQASWDAWIKYYRPDENTPNATVSYYTKGALVALCLDLALRQEGHTTLDAVMRGLWQRCAAGPMHESDLLAVLQHLSGRSWDAQIAAWVHGTHDVPLAPLLAAHGITLKNDVAQIAQRLGVRVQEHQGIHIKTVLRDGPAEQAGFMAGDEWLGLQAHGQAWRLHKLDDVTVYAAPDTHITALVARDAQLLFLPMKLPPLQSGTDSVRLEISDAARVERWLNGHD